MESRSSFAEADRRAVHSNRRAEPGSGSGTICKAVPACSRMPHVSVAKRDSTVTAAVLQRRVEEYQAGPFPEKWEDCKVFKDHRSMIESDAKPAAVVVGIPPAMHGKAPFSALNQSHIWQATQAWKRIMYRAQGLWTLLERQWTSNLPKQGFI